MKKYYVQIWLILIFLVKVNAQDVATKNLDFIIVIDDNIAIGSISSLNIELDSEKSKKQVTVSYYPGNLSLSSLDYNTLLSDSIKTIFLNFNYYEYSNQNQEIYNYEIELKKEWLKDYFNILRIYNLKKKKYKGKYRPISVGKNYNYEITSPSHSFKLIEQK